MGTKGKGLLIPESLLRISPISDNFSPTSVPLSKISANSSAGGRSFGPRPAFGFLMSRSRERRLPVLSYLRRLSMETFHDLSFSLRSFHHSRQGANSSNLKALVLVYFFLPSGSGCS